MIEPRPIYSKSSKTPGKIIGWLARWYGPDGRQHSRACRTKSAARKHARDMESLRDAGRYPNERRRKPDAVSTMPTVAEYAYVTEDARLEAERSREFLRKVMRGRIRHCLEETPLGQMPLDAARAKDVRAWLIELQHRYESGSVRRSLSMLRRVYDAAVEDEELPTVEVTPARGRGVPATKAPYRPPPPMPTLEQLFALADLMPDDELRTMVFVQAALGLRLGELCGLREQDIDFPRRRVRIDGQIRAEDRGVRTDDVKTASSRRTIVLQRLPQLVLSEHLARHPQRGPDGLVFAGVGGAQSRQRYTRRFRAAAAALAAEDPTFPPKLVPHHLRHMQGSVFMAAGGVHADAAQRLGHKNTKLLIGTYEHVMPARDAEQHTLLDDAWGGEEGAVRAATGANVDSTWTRNRRHLR